MWLCPCLCTHMCVCVCAHPCMVTDAHLKQRMHEEYPKYVWVCCLQYPHRPSAVSQDESIPRPRDWRSPTTATAGQIKPLSYSFQPQVVYLDMLFKTHPTGLKKNITLTLPDLAKMLLILISCKIQPKTYDNELSAAVYWLSMLMNNSWRI